MLVSERLMIIRQELQKKSVITLREMAELLDASESTVRRDFDELEKAGALIRVYGGAMRAKDSITLSESIEPNMEEKEVINNDKKRVLCAEAAKLIRDGDCVFIDGGTTFRYLFEYLKCKRIKIVTHSLLYLREMQDAQAEIIVIGGYYNVKYGMNVGQITSDLLRQFNFDYAFIGCVGVDVLHGAITAADIETASIKRIAMRNANRKLLLVDSTKMNTKGFFGFETLGTFDAVFTDAFPEWVEKPDNVIICGASASQEAI